MPEFQVLREGRAARGPVSTDVRPPDELLERYEDGTVIAGPDGVQWIVMPEVRIHRPRRWEKVKRALAGNGAASAPKPAAPAGRK